MASRRRSGPSGNAGALPTRSGDAIAASLVPPGSNAIAAAERRHPRDLGPVRCRHDDCRLVAAGRVRDGVAPGGGHLEVASGRQGRAVTLPAEAHDAGERRPTGPNVEQEPVPPQATPK